MQLSLQPHLKKVYKKAIIVKQSLSLRVRAMAFLSRREYSRLELVRKLSVYTDNTEQLAKVLDDLVNEDWLSDSRYTENLVYRRANTHGIMHIAAELQQNGIADAVIADICANLRETEVDRAQIVRQKRFSTETTAKKFVFDRQEFAKQARFLVGRGFSNDIIFRVLGQAAQD